MIIPFDMINNPNYEFGYNVFLGKVESDPEDDWRSLIPDITNLSAAGEVDPSVAMNLVGDADDDEYAKGGSTHALIAQYVGQLAMKDWVRGTRETLGAVAQTTGIIGADLMAVNQICQGTTTGIVKAFKVTDAVIGSEAFQMAIDAIGVIPVVGWIIKAAYEIGKTVASVIVQMQDTATETARRELSKRLTIPFGSMTFSPDANDALSKQFFSRIKNNSADDLIRPAYGFNGPGGPFASPGVYEDSGDSNPGDGMAAGVIVHGSSPGAGFGYVPGSSSMTRSIFFPAKLNSGGGCDAGAMRDMATLYPTAQTLCTGWWSQVNTPGPSMFSVQPRASKGHWENYIQKMFALAKDLLKGWSCAPTGKPFTDKFRCLKDEPYLWDSSSTGGMGGCGEKGNLTSGDWMTIPQDFGRGVHTSFYGYLCRLYFGLDRPFDMNRGGLLQLPRLNESRYGNGLSNSHFYHVSALDLSKSVPVSALETLYLNQRATLKSVQCMYVSGEDDQYGNRDRFPAFKDSSLRALWNQSVQDVFDSNSWERVSFQDIPDGKVKEHFYQKATANGVIDVENFNRPCAPGESPATGCGIRGLSKKNMLSAGPQVPDNPTLPTVPIMNGSVIQATMARGFRTVGSGKKKSSNMPLILGASALAFLMLRGRK